MIPGNPADQILGDYATASEKEELLSRLGLNLPLYRQILNYLLGLSHFDLGVSLIDNTPVTSLLIERLPGTIELALVSLCVAILISLPLGILSASYKGSLLDRILMTFAVSGVAIPNFWLAPILILFFPCI